MRTSYFNRANYRALFYQVLVVLIVMSFVGFLVFNTITNLQARHIASGFHFLTQPAGFEIGESLIDYSADSSYAAAIAVGLLNTLKVAVLCIVLATIIGILIGVGRLSRAWLVHRICSVYVELIRNVPLILQLFLWYALVSEFAPSPQQALQLLPDVFLSNRGLSLPGWVEGSWSVPVLQGFDFEGGLNLSPEFAALTVGLTVYSASFIAEVVRAGIQAVSRGQTEAGRSVGLTETQILRYVVLPQSLRVMIPPMTSQYLNIVKNSSLAIAIGYPDLVSVTNTTINQTGQAIEGVMIIMGAYLVVSLAISLLMNWYNARITLREGTR